MKYPNDPKSIEARALLLLADDGKFDATTLGATPGEAAEASQALGQLGWPCVEFPLGSGSMHENVNDIVFGLRESAARRVKNDVARTTFKSSEFAAWRKQAVAALAGSGAKRGGKPSKWSPADYSGYRGAKLTHPAANRASFRLLFALMHVREVAPDDAEMKPLQLVASVNELQHSGWPVTFQTNPVRAVWHDVPKEVLDAWRDAFGARGQDTALSGEWLG